MGRRRSATHDPRGNGILIRSCCSKPWAEGGKTGSSLPPPARAPPGAEPRGEAACEAADSGGVLRPDSRPETPLRSPPRLTAIRPPQSRCWVCLCSVHGARPSLRRAAGEGLLSRQRSASVTRFVSRVAFHCRGRPARPAKRLEKRPRIYLLSAVGR